MCPRSPAKGAPKGKCGDFLRHEIYKNSVSSVEAGMCMEGQIMCLRQCTFQMSAVAFLSPQNATKSLAAGASPQTSPGELTALPRPRS